MAGKLAQRSQAERRQATRAELLAAAEQVFAAEGFDSATLTAIAETAGLSKGAIYHHFPSKDELMLAVLQTRFDERISAVDPIAASPGEAAASRLVEEIPFQRRWNLLFLEYVVKAARDERFAQLLREQLARLRTRSSNGMAEFLEREGLEPPLSPGDLALAVAALGNGLAIEGLIGTESDTDPLYASILTLLLEGLRSRGER